MIVEEIMTKDVVTVDKDDSLKYVLDLMEKNVVSSAELMC